MKLEGIVSKRADAAYAPGDRGLWLKVKCLHREEFVVIGWTDPEGSRPFLGALLLGYYDPEGRLIYAGRVGTGIGTGELERLWRRLQPLAMPAMPLEVPPRGIRFGLPLVLSRVHWVRPDLVAEVKFLAWTEDNLLRQVVYEGLREDKPAKEVRRKIARPKPSTGDKSASGENHAAVNRQSFLLRHASFLRENAVMVLVVRIDRWEYIGYFTDLKGPLPAGAHGCIFDA
jgi:ATP-dependent DNA ligase